MSRSCAWMCTTCASCSRVLVHTSVGSITEDARLQLSMLPERQLLATHVHVIFACGMAAMSPCLHAVWLNGLKRSVQCWRCGHVYPSTSMLTGGMCAGFLQQFVGVCKPDQPHADLAAVLQQLSGGRAPTRVICTGHSLGGALATLGASWAALQWAQADVRCITFGSPRVGNKSFKKAFHSLVGTSLRLVHGRDPVPVLPPGVV